jgi:hypothetical protein
MESTEGCNVSPSPTDVSLTENSWMLHPLDKASLGYVPLTEPSHQLQEKYFEQSDRGVFPSGA